MDGTQVSDVSTASLLLNQESYDMETGRLPDAVGGPLLQEDPAEAFRAKFQAS